MREQNFGSSKGSKLYHTSFYTKKPGFRTIYKSRSGLFRSFDEAQKYSTIQNNMNTTQKSFRSNIENQTKSNFKKLFNKEQDSKQKSITSQQSISQVLKNQLKTQSKIQLPVIKQSSPQQQQQNWGQLSIDQVQRKVDNLIQLKLQAAMQKINQQNQQNQFQKIDNKINKVVQFLQRQQGQQENVQITNKKIYILQKILAQRAIESEIAKKYFNKKVNNRKQRIPDLLQYKINIQELKQRTKKLIHRNTPASIHFQSTAQINYKAPDKSAYVKRPQKPLPNINNQPLPRSSYGRDYLYYKNIPKYIHKQSSTQQLPNYSIGKRSSSYQDEFTSKKFDKINFKQLDCYQDKFRNLKIPLICQNRKNQEIQPPLLSIRMKTLENPEQYSNKSKVNHQKTSSSHYIKNLSTENNLNYKGENNNIRSQIKHQRLTNLKYSYKAALHV